MNHFSYLSDDGFHVPAEPKLRLYGARAPWYRQISLVGFISTIALLGIITGVCTGLYSCSQKAEVKEVVAYEFPVAHTVEVSHQKPTLSGSVKKEKSRP